MFKAVAYARYSSDMQREESIEAQIKAVYDYAEKKGITIIHEYIDRAISGRSVEKRDAFLQMIKDASGKQFQFVLAHESSRFARNREESAIYKHKLKKLGVKVVFVSQDFGEGEHTVIIESLMEGLDEYYSLNLAKQTMKGLKVNASKCKYNGGRVLYGYKVNEGKLYEVEPAEASVVSNIFGKIAKGWSYVEILRYLDESGTRNKSGKKFAKNSLHDMLRNERYSGVYIFNKTPKRHPVTGERTSRYKNPDEEIIRIEGGVPEIVPRQQWEKVQEILDNRKQKYTSARKRKYLLTGFIECAVCGGAYIGTTSITQYSERGYYICTSKKNHSRDCNNNNIPQHNTENRVVEMIEKLLDSISVPDLTKTLNKLYNDASSSQQNEKQRIEKELSLVNKKINNLLDNLEAGESSELIKDRLKQNAELKKQLESKLQEINTPSPIVTESIVKKLIEDLRIADKSPEQKRAVFYRMGLKIYVYPDGTDISLGKKNDVINQRVESPTPQIITLLADLIREEVRTRC